MSGVILEQMGDTVKLGCECPFCGDVRHITVKLKAYDRYMRGEYAQKAFPHLSPSQREAIKTGICESCFP